jgi:hypothetical protein
MVDGREWLANMRRKYLHVKAGGTLHASDIGCMVEDAEKCQRKLESLTEAFEELRRERDELIKGNKTFIRSRF